MVHKIEKTQEIIPMAQPVVQQPVIVKEVPKKEEDEFVNLADLSDEVADIREEFEKDTGW